MTSEIYQKLNQLNEMSRGTYESFKEETLAMEQQISDLKKKLENTIGTKLQLAQEEERVNQEIKDLKKNLMTQHQQKTGELWNHIQNEINKHHGVENHPKLSTAWAIAWDKGHAYGYYEVAQQFDSFVELLK